MNDTARAIVAIWLMFMPWVCFELGKMRAEEELKEKEYNSCLEILGIIAKRIDKEWNEEKRK